MLPYYEREHEPKQNNIDFESVREMLMKEDFKMVVKRQFERVDNMMKCKSYMINEVIPENKEIFLYGLKRIETDKIDKYILIGCESDELYEIDKLFNFSSNKFINKEIETRNFNITGWSFLTLIEETTFSKSRAIIVVESFVLFNCCLFWKLFIWVCDFIWLL